MPVLFEMNLLMLSAATMLAIGGSQCLLAQGKSYDALRI